MLYHSKSDNGNSVIMKIEDFWEIQPCHLPELCENKSLTYNIPTFSGHFKGFHYWWNKRLIITHLILNVRKCAKCFIWILLMYSLKQSYDVGIHHHPHLHFKNEELRFRHIKQLIQGTSARKMTWHQLWTPVFSVSELKVSTGSDTFLSKLTSAMKL